MRLAKHLISLILLISIISCAGSKAKKYLREGSTVQKNYKTTIPFKMKNGLIIMNVEIKNKTYNFILDTGASNILSKELAETLNTKTIDSESVYDIYGKAKNLEYTRIDKIGIGNIDFVETIAAIADYNSVPLWSCMKIDGIIGSNLMQHAIWDFDFVNNVITITDNESKLNLPSDIIENKLFIGFAGIPSVATKINGKKVWNNTVDFGYNGGINIPFGEFEKQKENGKIREYVQVNSKGVTGIYGENNDIKKSYLSRIETINFGGAILKNKIVTSEESLNKLFGLDFFKDYRVILNWNSKKIKLISKKSTTDLGYSSFGFSYSFKNNGLNISKIYAKTKASDYLKIGDKILSINEKDYSYISEEGYCAIVDTGVFGKTQKFEIKVLRNNEELTFKIEKEKLL